MVGTEQFEGEVIDISQETWVHGQFASRLATPQNQLLRFQMASRFEVADFQNAIYEKLQQIIGRLHGNHIRVMMQRDGQLFGVPANSKRSVNVSGNGRDCLNLFYANIAALQSSFGTR